MFTVTRVGDNRVDIEMSGKLDSEHMKTALDEMVSKSEGIENGTMLYDIVDFRFPSIGAIGIEFSRLPSMFRLMKRFDRAAVLADKAWLRIASEIEGAAYPGLEIKTFTRDQRTEAETWLRT
ncbi:MAG: STAS/SEC14 domain-containing protein [Acidobacteriota bacterium]|nr:STAS/SEC14 domain-containing protein [Acidobacteriota bacterium]MDH3785893.1 STAS/SEC14 domain-containing protein [Acidobacteriota bacterium]